LLDDVFDGIGYKFAEVLLLVNEDEI
jgi:hypothetical protein